MVLKNELYSKPLKGGYYRGKEHHMIGIDMSEPGTPSKRQKPKAYFWKKYRQYKIHFFIFAEGTL
jgi:hypothetical protein